MKYEYLKEYKTRGGWKAVYLGVDRDFDHIFFHENEKEIFYHKKDGCLSRHSIDNRDIIEEWKEPRTCTFWINFYKDCIGEIVCGRIIYYSEKYAQEQAKDNASYLFTRKFTVTEGEKE